MNPIALWILSHRRETWSDPAVRQRYESLSGQVSDAEWRAGFAQAVRDERVRRALDETHGNAYVGTALRGVIAYDQQVTVPVLARWRDPFGIVVTSRIDVVLSRDDRIRDIDALVADAVAERYDMQNLTVVDYTLLPGARAS